MYRNRKNNQSTNYKPFDVIKALISGKVRGKPRPLFLPTQIHDFISLPLETRTLSALLFFFKHSNLSHYILNNPLYLNQTPPSPRARSLSVFSPLCRVLRLLVSCDVASPRRFRLSSPTARGAKGDSHVGGGDYTLLSSTSWLRA